MTMREVPIAEAPAVSPAELTTPVKRKAISYIRYSSCQQGKEGRDSTRRQQEALNDALAQWSLALDQEFIDKGKSGYHQRHLAKGGAMYELRHLALEGHLVGKVICLEDWDRAGRMQVMDAAPLLMDILNNGCDMIVGEFGGEYLSKDIVNANKRLLFNALEEMDRGHRESKRKTKLAKAKWKARHDDILDGKLTALNNVPFWLANERNNVWECTGKFVVREGMKDLIQRIYAMYLKGNGGQVIAKQLNREGVPIPTNRDGRKRKNASIWYPGYVQRIIKSRALMGYYRDSDRKIFPELVSESDYYSANQTRKDRVHFAGRKSFNINPFSGLCSCPNCGGSMTPHESRPKSSKKHYNYITCRHPKKGDCTSAGMLTERFEESFAGFLGYIDNISNTPALKTNKSNGIRAKIESVEQTIENLKVAFESVEASQAVSLGGMITDYDKKRAQLLKELEQELINEKGNQGFSKNDFEFLKSLFAKKLSEQDRDTRLAIQEALRKSIDRIVIDPKTQSYTVAWKNSKDIYKVELTKNGYKVTGNGCVNLELEELD